MTTKNETAGTEMPDFSRVNLNKYSNEELTFQIIRGYLNYLVGLMQWLCSKGEQKELLT